MENNSYSLSKNLFVIPQTHSSLIGILRKERVTSLSKTPLSPSAPYTPYYSTADQIWDESSRLGVNLEQQDLERYRNSFLKRRILTIWKNQRALILASPQLPKLLEKIIYHSVYTQLQPVLYDAYHEDFALPLFPFTFLGWLHHTQLTSQIVGKYGEPAYWDELAHFFHHCNLLQLLDDLGSETKRPTN